QAGRGRQGLIVVLEAGMGRQVREENGFVGPVVEHTDVAGIGPGTVTRKYQKQPKSKGHERKALRHDPLTNSAKWYTPASIFAFASAVAYGHEPHAGVSILRQPHQAPASFKG